MHLRQGLLTLALLLSAPVLAESPSQVGQWSDPVEIGDVAVHTHVLPDGNILFWPRGVDPNTSADLVGRSAARIWNPVTQTFVNSSVLNNQTNVFCSGHTLLPDGRLLVAGGHIAVFEGARQTNIFDWKTQTWTKGQDMNRGRWYPSAVALASGEALVLAGVDESGVFNDLPQVWKTSGGWRDLSTARRSMSPYFPWIHLAPNGQVFQSGPDPDTYYLDTSGTGTWNFVGNTQYGSRYDYGTSVMYQAGKVLILGGGDPPTATAEVINLRDANPQWRFVSSMAFARRQLNATILPDGTVLVTGGTSGPGFDNAASAVYPAELWNPNTEQWTGLAAMHVPRLYHSTAVLLPDGRVLSAGGGAYNSTKPTANPDHTDAEFFSPPYLFKGTRPTITSAPTEIKVGQFFSVATPDTTSISRVTLIRLSSVTHAFNMNQRFNELSFFKVGVQGLIAKAPASANLLPPGHYLLFILNSAGVPSVAKILRVS